jgi:hypothetical protein
VQTFNPQIKFISKFWELLEDEEIIIERAENEGSSINKSKVFGIYKIDDNDELKIGLSINKIFNRVESSLGGKGTLGISKKELKKKLLESHHIHENNSGTVAIGKGLRGVYWIGEVPRRIKNTILN